MYIIVIIVSYMIFGRHEFASTTSSRFDSVTLLAVSFCSQASVSVDCFSPDLSKQQQFSQSCP